MKFRLMLALTALLFVFRSEDLWCNENRPKIGLALSGGGARGLAHVGVLRWFEENRIPVDYLAGASMGALVGGMYSIGMTPDEMETLLDSVNWSKAFGSGIAYQENSFRRKEDRRNYSVNLELGLREGLSAPSGLSSGHYVGLLIDRITLPYSNVENFDSLPIPFRCVATDAIAAEEIILDRGHLSSAMRASMSLPGVFPPVKLDGRWLIDGGVLNNIPTDIVRNMGADIVIAVDVGTPLGDEKAMRSIFGVLSQTILVMTASRERENRAAADILITPDVGNLSNTDFSKIENTMQKGFPAAENKSDELKALALDPASWQKYLSERIARTNELVEVPTSVQVLGVGNDAAEELKKHFESYVGQRLDLAVLEEDVTKLAGEGRYESIGYSIVTQSPDRNVLQIRIREKSYAPPTLNFQLGMEGTDVTDFNFSFGARLTLFDIEDYGSEWRNDFNVGFQSFFATEYYWLFAKQGFFAAPRAFYSRDKRSFFSGGARVAEFDVNEYAVGGDIGKTSSRTEIRIGIQAGHLDADLSTGQAPIDSINGAVTFARVRWAFDGANSPTIPTQGIRMTAESRWYFTAPEIEEDFAQLEIRSTAFQKISQRGNIFESLQFGTTFDRNAAPAQQFTLGGPFRLSAYDRDEFRGNHSLLITGGYMHKISELPPLIGGNIWLTGWYSVGDAFMDFGEADYKNQFAVGLLMDTFLGPFSLVSSWGSGDSSTYFTFGRFF